MLVGDGLSFKTFDVYKIAVIVIAGIALTPHATRAIAVEVLKIRVDDLLG
jgi:hypothetical protein